MTASALSAGAPRLHRWTRSGNLLAELSALLFIAKTPNPAALLVSVIAAVTRSSIGVVRASTQMRTSLSSGNRLRGRHRRASCAGDGDGVGEGQTRGHRR